MLARPEGRDDLELDLDYLDQRLGGYGQVYRGAMGDIGLIIRAENTPGARLDAPLGDLGASVADAFGRAISGTTYAREYADRTDGTIPLAVICRSGTRDRGPGGVASALSELGLVSGRFAEAGHGPSDMGQSLLDG